MRKLLKLAVVSSAAVAALGMTRQASAQAATPTCASLPDPVYVAGSSAVRPVLQSLGKALANAATPSTVVYIGASGSCDGVNSIVTGLKVTAGPKYIDNTGALLDCTLPAGGQLVDVGMSDVFPTSCPDVTTDLLTGIGDFAGPVQSMNFVVPKAATQTTISAEAAYLTFGLGAAGKTDWDNPALYAVRNFQSGTETMTAKAINVPTNKWLGVDKGGSGGVVTAISTPAGDVNKTIGILASNEADTTANRMTIKRLAFQPYGEQCALYPDSSFASLDKFNVRNGLYQIWGPLHMLAKVDAQGVPTNAKAKQLLDVLLGSTNAVIDGVDPITIEIDNNTVPQCAMNVQRKAELGAATSYNPVGQCDCYFEEKRGVLPTSCKTCTKDADCSGATPVCSPTPTGHRYCEVK